MIQRQVWKSKKKSVILKNTMKSVKLRCSLNLLTSFAIVEACSMNPAQHSKYIISEYSDGSIKIFDTLNGLEVYRWDNRQMNSK